jgi:hypothetical protein
VLVLPGEVNAANVTSATEALTKQFSEADSQIEKKSHRCAQLKLKRALRCERSVRRARRTLARRRELVDRLSACGKETDDQKRFTCANSVVRTIGKESPKLCRRSTNCPKKQLAIAAFSRALSRLQAVATNLTNVDAAVTAVDSRRAARLEKKAACVKIESRSSRRACQKAQKSALKLIKREKDALTEMKACTTNPDLDADKQSECANAVTVKFASGRPRNCSVRKRVSLHPRKKVLELRRRLVKCKTSKCREHLNSLIRIQLQSLIERRHQRRALHTQEVLRRQVIYSKIAACGDDAVCRHPYRVELAQMHRRSTRRRARRLASLTQLRKLQKRMRLCRKDGEGLVCRRSVIEDYRAAIQDLALSMNAALNQEATREYKRSLKACKTNVDVPACRAAASQVFVDRLIALSVDAAQMQFVTATRMCALAPDGVACVDAAKVARDQDMAIQKDEASAIAAIIQKRIQ